nr:uncharacterized protein LOC126055152 isoform X1 [Helicoverpa armigera]
MPCGALCAVDGCKSSKRRDKHLTFFHLPVNEERRKTWAELIGRPDLARPEIKPKSHYVCCLHFEKSVIIHIPQLRPNALPTQLLPPLPTTSSASTEPKSKMPGAYCAVFGCFNAAAANPELSFFGLPTDYKRRATWLQLICREELQDRNPNSYTVCETHFDPRAVIHGKLLKRLRAFSIPTRNLPNKDVLQKETQTEVRTTENKFAQTDFYVLKLESAAQTPNYLQNSLPCVKKLKEELTTCKKQTKSANASNLSKDTFHKLCDKFLTKPLAEIVKAQTKLKFHGKGNRYSPKYKQFCINLYYTSPQAYKLLEQALCLPNVATLGKHSLPVSTELNEHLMATLQAKVNNMSNSERICSVVVDAVSLKSSLFYNIRLDKIIGLQEVNGVQSPVLAGQAVVVIIRGIFGNWQQPIGFALLGDCNNSEDISRWIEKLLERLLEVGLDIRTFISDLESDLLSEEKKKFISIEKPYFFINNRKIFYIIDSLHLIKSLRNNLMVNDFYFQGSVAKYEHILQFYESEKNKSFRLAPKLSETHIKPSNFEKKQVHYATELLSHTVATAISCYIDFQAISGAAQDTVKLIKIINDLFDILNSSTVHSTCEYKQAFCGSLTQRTFMNEMLEFFKSLKLINSTTGRDVTSTAKFIRGYQITITSILLLFDDLTAEGYNNLLTRRLNQDVTDIFFGQVRRKRKRPSTRQFMTAFRKIFFSNIIKAGKQGKSSGDLSQLLVNTEKLGVMLSAETEENALGMEEDCNETNTEASTHPISTSDYNNIELPEINKLKYISSYLFKKCVITHGGCEQLKQSLKLDNTNETIQMDVDGLTNTGDIDVQVAPPDSFDNFVQEMERCYQNFFNNCYINSKIAKSILESMNQLIYCAPCSCFPINYAKKLFIRIRIYITVRNNNEELSKHRSTKKLFSVANL